MPPMPNIKTAAIIGAGVIGAGWAARFALNGWTVRIFDPDPDAPAKLREVMDNARRVLPMLYECALPTEGKITFHPSIAEAITPDTAWIQESVSERLPLKTQIYQQIEQVAAPAAIIGSSTSGFRPSQLQEGLKNPAAVMVAHPFNPVYLLPLIEVVPTPQNPPETITRACTILTSLGFHPLHVKKQIDAHIADRFLEAVWREALWLVKDGIATTEDIDNAIRYGFGLRWAQMGLFETFRIAGGTAGMEHFLHQFGPCLKWPWTRLMDVPDLDETLIGQITQQSDDQAKGLSIRELEQLRDNNLVAILRALKAQNAAAGQLIKDHEASLPKPKNTPKNTGKDKPLQTVNRTIPIDWTDYNGHMNESRYGQVFSDAADSVMQTIGANADYINAGQSYFTVDIHIKFLQETHSGDKISVETIVLLAQGKKLRLFHKMFGADGTLLATGEQMLIHVSLTTRRACEPRVDILNAAEKLAARHADLAIGV